MKTWEYTKKQIKPEFLCHSFNELNGKTELRFLIIIIL